MTGVFMSNENNIVTKEHVIAFVDILGATEKMNENQDEILQIVHKVYNDILKENSSSNQAFLKAYNSSNKLIKREEPIIKLNIFSDNILFSSRITGSDSIRNSRVIDSLHLIIISVAKFQLHLSTYGILLRGAITLGNLFSDNILVWGTGLVKAVELEKKYAKNPKIIIDHSLLEFNFNENTLIMDWLCSEDGFYYIDYLNYKILGNYIFQTVDELEKMNNAEIIKKVGQYITNNNNFRTLEKLYWQKMYLDKKKSFICEGK